MRFQRENQGDFTLTAKHLSGSVYKDIKEFHKTASAGEEISHMILEQKYPVAFWRGLVIQ